MGRPITIYRPDGQSFQVRATLQVGGQGGFACTGLSWDRRAGKVACPRSNAAQPSLMARAMWSLHAHWPEPPLHCTPAAPF